MTLCTVSPMSEFAISADQTKIVYHRYDHDEMTTTLADFFAG